MSFGEKIYLPKPSPVGKLIWLVGWLIMFYSTLTLLYYSMLNPVYSYILSIYDLVWLSFMAYQPL